MPSPPRKWVPGAASGTARRVHSLAEAGVDAREIAAELRLAVEIVRDVLASPRPARGRSRARGRA